MIKKIVIRDVASYDQDGVTFDNLARVNFIYGGNGTGKTTLTRVLENPSAYPQCQVEWEDAPVKVLVYNKDFRVSNFKESIPGVFALGAEGVNSSRELEELRRKRVELGNETKRVKDRMDRVKHRIEVENRGFADNMWYYYGTREPFSVVGEVARLDKFSFAEKVKELVKNGVRDHTITYNHLFDLYHDCFNGGNLSIDKLKQLQDDVWKFLAGACRGDVRLHEEIIQNLNDDLAYWVKEDKRAMRDYKKVIAQIDGRESELTSVLPTIDRINRMLELSHFTGFSIQPSPAYPNYYQIQRSDGSFVNDTLSEGEANFIAFLYFYQLAVGNNLDFDIGTKRVLVIDDPMSSMDSNVMMIVSEMVRGLMGVEQLFVLTHNKMFHKQVSWRQHRHDVHYWMLGKREGRSYARDYGEENPVKSEYAMLWQELKEVQQGNDSVTLQNVMRRIVEYYFVELGGYPKWKLIPDHFSDDSTEMIIVRSLLKWADEGSHSATDDLYAELPQVENERYMEVFKRLFEKLGQGEHYRMMMRVD